MSTGQYGDHGMCSRHYDRLIGDYIDIDGHELKPIQRNRLGARKCRVIECMANPRTVGLCPWHYRNSQTINEWAVDYDDPEVVISYQQWDAMRKPVQDKPKRRHVTELDDPDDDPTPLALVEPIRQPERPQPERILDFGDCGDEHPDAVIISGQRYVPESNKLNVGNFNEFVWPRGTLSDIVKIVLERAIHHPITKDELLPKGQFK